MAKPEPKKRELSFSSYEDMLAEAQSLLDKGYISHGNWSLAQVCGHLSDWMQFPLDGFPKSPLPMRMIFWVMKKTIGPGMKRKILTNGFKSGIPTAPETVPKPDAMTDQQAVELFRKTVDRRQAYQGELLPSPFFGPLDRETQQRLGLLHAALHLGYLEPK